jgi:hypothetical protein
VAVRDAIVSGEEYELLVASPALDVAAFAGANDGLALTAVGMVEAPDEAGIGESVAEEEGRRTALPAAHDHFAAR